MINKFYAVTHISLFTYVMLTSFVEAKDELEAVKKAGYSELVEQTARNMMDVRIEAFNQETMIEVKEIPDRLNSIKQAEYFKRNIPENVIRY